MVTLKFDYDAQLDAFKAESSDGWSKILSFADGEQWVERSIADVPEANLEPFRREVARAKRLRSQPEIGRYGRGIE